MFRLLTIALTFYLPMAMADGEIGAKSKYTAVKGLTEGTYYTKLGYLISPSIREWADEYVMTGLISYGQQKQRFQVTLNQSTKEGKENYFVGDGLIEQVWTSGHVCTYKMKAEVRSYEDTEGTPTLFMRHYGPETIYTTWDIYTYGCPPPAKGPVWRTAPEPYILGR